MKEFLQFTRGSGTSERRCLNSQCALLGEVSEPGWLLLDDVPPPLPFHHLHKSNRPPSHHHYALLSMLNVLPVTHYTAMSQ